MWLVLASEALGVCMRCWIGIIFVPYMYSCNFYSLFLSSLWSAGARGWVYGLGTGRMFRVARARGATDGSNQ